MPPKKKAPRVWTASAVKAEDITPHTCAEFRLKWTPTQFCRLSSSERKAILLGLLTSSDSISIVQVHGGYNFATEHTPIHGAMPLLYDFSTNKQIAREACEVFYQNNTFILSSRWLPHLVLDQTNTWIMRETIQPRLLFRNLQILLDHHEPQTPATTSVELASLLSCTRLDRLVIELCAPECLAGDPEGLREWLGSEAMGLGAVIGRLKERFGGALTVMLGGPFVTRGREDGTGVWERRGGEVVGAGRSGGGSWGKIVGLFG